MTDPQANYPDFATLNNDIQTMQSEFILVTHRNVRDYEGMVLCTTIRFDTRQDKYLLDLEWMSLGLDLYGDALQESYSYQFKSLELLLEYLLLRYDIRVTDIPVTYQFDSNQFPNPIKVESKKQVFENGWQRFREDFQRGLFLDGSLKLAYSSANE